MDTLEKLRSLSDRYEIVREIGVGGMATVYLARDLKHDREVALKVLRADLSAVIGTERFLAEVRIAARLDHPHILTLIDSGSADGLLYYVLPYVRGESLRAKLNREKQLGVQEALSIISQVASALDYAHAQGVVHRDIKPENILLHEGEAVLADFGIALAVKEAGGNRLTETGLSLGTPLYMSPEQATGDRSLDRRSDVYSLGAVFYEMMAGEPPVTGPSAQAIIAKLLTQKAIKLRVVRDTVPLAIEQATEKALAKTPADRFGSAGDFARALSAATPEPERRLSRSRKMRVAAAGVAIVALGGGAWLARDKLDAGPRKTVALRDRTQITNIGRVSLPDISDDGKTIVYVVTDCGAKGCSYSVELQDVLGRTSRRLLEGATAAYRVEVSPDRRNVLFLGTINNVYGSFLVSTLGASPRYLPNVEATFWAGGDSLLLFRPGIPSEMSWILVGGLDGVPSDSVRVVGPKATIRGVAAVPNSPRLMYALFRENTLEWVSSDRSGQRHSSIQVQQDVASGRGVATIDALWIEVLSPSTFRRSVVRIPFDGATGRLGEAGDTVYSGTPTSFGVTADGGTLLLDEGTAEYSVWALSFDDLLNGRFTEEKRRLRATSSFGASLSSDGRFILFGRNVGSVSDDRQWAVMPFGGGAEIAIPGRHQSARFLDSSTLEVTDATASGVQLSLLHYRTHARSALLAPKDSAIYVARRLPSAGWAWISLDLRAINVQRDDEARPRKFEVPAWCSYIWQMSVSADGRTVAFVGWNAPSEDSLTIGLLSLPEGRFTRSWTTLGETGGVRWLVDGSLMIQVAETPASSTFHRMHPDGRIERLGSSLRPTAGINTSQDLRWAVATTRDYRGDAWTSKVVR